jgi:sugar phosphate permease
LLNPFVCGVAISNWFVRRRGRALGIAAMGTGISKIVIAPIAAVLLVTIGWRNAWIALGIATLVVAVVPSLLFMRRRPEDMGLHPDGDEAPPTAVDPQRPRRAFEGEIEGETWTRREALRTSTLWLIALTFAIVNVGNLGLNLHIFPWVTDLGYDEAFGAWVVSALAVSQAFSTPLWGWLTDRFDPRFCACGQFAVQVVGLALAWGIGGPLMLLAGFFLYGSGLGGGLVIQDTIWASAFGRRSLGTVRSVALPVQLGIGSLGPIFFGYLHDATGDYTVAFIAFNVALAISAALILLVRPPRKRLVPASIG